MSNKSNKSNKIYVEIGLSEYEFRWLKARAAESARSSALSLSKATDPEEQAFLTQCVKTLNALSEKLDAIDPNNTDRSQDCDEDGNPI